MSMQITERLSADNSEHKGNRKFTPETYRRRLVELGLAEADSHGRLILDNVVDDVEQAFAEARAGKEYRDWQKIIERVARLFIDAYERARVADIETTRDSSRSVFEIAPQEERSAAYSRLKGYDIEKEFRHLILQGLRNDIYAKLSSVNTREVFRVGHSSRERNQAMKLSNGHSLSLSELALINADRGDEALNRNRAIAVTRILGDWANPQAFGHKYLRNDNQDDARDIVRRGNHPNMTDVVASLVYYNCNWLPDISRVGDTIERLALIHEDFRLTAGYLENKAAYSHQDIKKVKNVGTLMTEKLRGVLY